MPEVINFRSQAVDTKAHAKVCLHWLPNEVQSQHLTIYIYIFILQLSVSNSKLLFSISCAWKLIFVIAKRLYDVRLSTTDFHLVYTASFDLNRTCNLFFGLKWNHSFYKNILKYKMVGVLTIRIVKSNISSVRPSSERNRK